MVVIGVSNKNLFVSWDSPRRIFFKLSFWTFTFKLTILLIRFQITGPLYCADSFPTFYFTLASMKLNPEKIRFERVRCSALPTEVPSHQVIATCAQVAHV